MDLRGGTNFSDFSDATTEAKTGDKLDLVRVEEDD